MDFEFKLYRKSLAFLVPYFAGAALFALLIYVSHKTGLHTRLRPRASIPVADLFFKYYTYLGAGYIAAPVVAAFLVLRKWKYAASLALSFGSAAVVTQGLKHYFNFPRPFQYFEEIQKSVPADRISDYNLWLVEGVKLQTSPSFPSGHATTGFVLFLGLAFVSQRPWIQATCLFLAVLVGYSRIYLTQHFAADVLVGSLIGVIITCVVFPVVSWAWAAWHRRKDENYIEDDD